MKDIDYLKYTINNIEVVSSHDEHDKFTINGIVQLPSIKPEYCKAKIIIYISSSLCHILNEKHSFVKFDIYIDGHTMVGNHVINKDNYKYVLNVIRSVNDLTSSKRSDMTKKIFKTFYNE